MIIDAILDRRDDERDGFNTYDARAFYDYVSAEEHIFGDKGIARALDSGANADVQNALCHYITVEHYNPVIKDYINSVQWVED